MDNVSDALNNQGLKFFGANQYQRAEEFFREAIAHDPDHADAHSNLGVVLFSQQKFDDAVIILARACVLRPDHADTLLNYGHSLWKSGDLLAARRVFEQANTIADTPQAHLSLAALCRFVGDDDVAIRHSRIVLQQEPDNLKAHDILCEVYHHRGREDEAMAECDSLLNIASSYRLGRSLVMLTYGNKAGWEEYECCYKERAHSGKNILHLAEEDPYWFAKVFDKKWDGQRTGHLLVSTEQGFGDVIQFMRFIPLAAERCTKVSVSVSTSLRHIARLSFDQPNIEFCDKLPHDFDHYCLIMSLAYLLDRTESIPSTPYLKAPKDRYDDVRRLARPKVGLAWIGGKQNIEDHWRSIPFEQIKTLLDVPVEFISLQYPCEDLSRYPIVQVPLSDDWTATAALIDALDLVITVDTAVAHMAGALNKPVWLMNRYNTDWRWMLDRADTPWYPTMRIFRQPKMGDWSLVIETIRAELINHLN